MSPAVRFELVAGFLTMLSLATGEAIEGIIGYNYQRGFTVMIDYPGSRLRLSK